MALHTLNLKQNVSLRIFVQCSVNWAWLCCPGNKNNTTDALWNFTGNDWKRFAINWLLCGGLEYQITVLFFVVLNTITGYCDAFDAWFFIFCQTKCQIHIWFTDGNAICKFQYIQVFWWQMSAGVSFQPFWATIYTTEVGGLKFLFTQYWMDEFHLADIKYKWSSIHIPTLWLQVRCQSLCIQT